MLDIGNWVANRLRMQGVRTVLIVVLTAVLMTLVLGGCSTPEPAGSPETDDNLCPRRDYKVPCKIGKDAKLYRY